MTPHEARVSQSRPARDDEVEVWLASEQEPASTRYHIPLAFRTTSAASPEWVRESVARLQARHRRLRSRFVVRDGHLTREVLDRAPAAFVVEHVHADYDVDDATAWATTAAARLMDLTQAPLIRVNVRCYRDSTVFVVTMHHIIADGWSVDLLPRELLDGGREDAAEAAEAVDDAAGQDVQGQAEDDIAYWTDLLADQSPSIVPMNDLTAQSVAGEPGFVRRSLDVDLLHTLCKDPALRPASTAVILLAVWTSLLHLWSGTAEGLSGLTFSGRLGEESHEHVGLMARLLPVKTTAGPHTPFTEVVAALRRQVVQSMIHSQVPAATVRRLLRLQSSSGQLGAAFNYTLAGPGRVLTEQGIALELLDVPLATGKNAVGLFVTDSTEDVRIQIDYDTDLYTSRTADLLIDQFCAAVRQLAERRDATGLTVAELLPPYDHVPATVSAAEDERWTSGVESPVDFIRRHALEHPDATAAVHGHESVTYGELYARASFLAHALRADGVKDGELVAVMLPRGIHALTTLVGVVAAGCAYLPLDPQYPVAQIRAILADSGVTRVVVDAASDIPEATSEVRVLRVEELESGSYADRGPAHYPHPSGELALFHCIYTSGSTGRPKGVMLDRRGFMRLLHHDGFLPVGRHDAMAHLSPLNFDASTFEIWAGLTQGAKLVILDKEDLLDPEVMAATIRLTGITVAIMTNPLFNHLVEHSPSALSAMRWIYIGGEAVSPEHVRKALAWTAPGVITHSYGPAENSFTTHCRPILQIPARTRTIPLGLEVPHTHAYVVYENTLIPTPQGVPGELLVGGPGIAWGYLGDPVRTALKFVPDPFGDMPSARLYRSGDRVRWDASGEIEFIGRLDNQVKIRGNRVELSGIESTLRAAPGITQACVLYTTDAGSGKELLAFVVPKQPGRIDEARRYLEAQLPAFAQPRRWIELDRLPRKQNNKIDQQALIDLARRQRVEATGGAAHTAAPETVAADRREETAATAATDAERVRAEIAAAWVNVLGHEDVTERNFFDAGGDSLLLFRLSEVIRQRLGRTLPVVELLRHTTVAAQTLRLAGRAPHSEVPRLCGGEGTAAAVAAPAFSAGTAAPMAIAIVGMACRTPGAADVTEFWDLLLSGRSAMVGPRHDFIRPLGDGRLFVQRWGAVEGGAYHYDPAGFGMRPDDAAVLDPQHGLFLECVRSAVEDAGYRLSDIAGSTSLVAGSARRARPLAAAAGAGGGESFLAELSDSGAYLATRAAYQFGLRGGAMMVDTACSTSLVAVNLACESLRRGEARFALAGGVSVEAPANNGYVYEPGLIYSPTGVCRPHDRRADGTIGGDGVGVVLLRPLEDALAAGDPVYAVIRGSAVNNDGDGKVGYTAPGYEGQVDVITKALATARVDGADIRYVETHGTGTRLGDGVEAAALAAALGSARRGACTLGAVKANIGHLNTASGVIGLIKTALTLHHRILPATPHVAEPIEELSQGERPLSLSVTTTALEPASGPVLAGVSSFGIGGTNAHAVLESA
ncbi:amino acid adenylation domain-containing protein [Nonomuraea sp. NPDC049152]|uniref:amino acid adenylation domain-containing protein n=1 Tax=Nonomuraea sp. NPDC049152 TaxID=3154350 RepID=UPI0033F67F21